MFSGGLLVTRIEEKAKQAKRRQICLGKKYLLQESAQKLHLVSVKTLDENACKTNN